MCLDVLLQILRPLERLATEITLVRLERHMHADVRRDVVALDRGRAALIPLARQVEVVCALAANMALADVVLRGWLVRRPAKMTCLSEARRVNS